MSFVALCFQLVLHFEESFSSGNAFFQRLFLAFKEPEPERRFQASCPSAVEVPLGLEELAWIRTQSAISSDLLQHGRKLEIPVWWPWMVGGWFSKLPSRAWPVMRCLLSSEALLLMDSALASSSSYQRRKLKSKYGAAGSESSSELNSMIGGVSALGSLKLKLKGSRLSCQSW